MITSSIKRIESDPMVILRKSYLDICGDKNTAKLLSYFEGQFKHSSGKQVHKHKDIYERCLRDISMKEIPKSRKKLVSLGFITEHKKRKINHPLDKIIQFSFHPEKISEAIEGLER